MKILYKLGRGRGPLLTEVHILEGWEFSDEDKSIVRHRKKQYKKSYYALRSDYDKELIKRHKK